MTSAERALAEINARYDEQAAQLRDLGATTADLTRLDDQRTRSLEQQAAALRQQIDDVLDGNDRDLRYAGMSDAERQMTDAQLLDLRNVVRGFDGETPEVPSPPAPLETVAVPRDEVCRIAPGFRGCPDHDYQPPVKVAAGEGVCVTTITLPPELKVLERGKFSTPATTIPGAMQRDIAGYARTRGANGATYVVGPDGSATATVYRWAGGFYLDCAAAGGNWY